MRVWGKSGMVSLVYIENSARPLQQNVLRRSGRGLIYIISCWHFESSSVYRGVFSQGLLQNLHKPQIVCKPRLELRTVREPGPVHPCKQIPRYYFGLRSKIVRKSKKNNARGIRLLYQASFRRRAIRDPKIIVAMVWWAYGHVSFCSKRARRETARRCDGTTMHPDNTHVQPQPLLQPPTIYALSYLMVLDWYNADRGVCLSACR